MQTDHMLGEEVCHLGSGGKLGERNVMYRFGKPVYDRKHCVVSLGWWEAGDEVYSDVRPRACRYLQGMEETSRWSVGVFVSSANVTCRHKSLDVGGETRPPEPATDEFLRSGSAGMARELKGMAPSKDLGSEARRNEEAVGRTATGARISLESAGNFSLNFPGKGPQKTRRG